MLEIAKVLRDLYASKTITVAAEARTNSVVIRCSEAVFLDVKRIVELLDMKPEKK